MGLRSVTPLDFLWPGTNVSFRITSQAVSTRCTVFDSGSDLFPLPHRPRSRLKKPSSLYLTSPSPFPNPLALCLHKQNPPPKDGDPVPVDANGDVPTKSSEACSPKKRLESAVETDRVLTNALQEAGAEGAAGGAAEAGGGGGAPAAVGDEPAP